MRGHGVPKFPGPKVTTGPGGGQGIDLRGAGLDLQAPAFQAAVKACGGGPKGMIRTGRLSPEFPLVEAPASG